MRILGIETSCDETAAAVVEDGMLVLSSAIASSRKLFERSGGVIPEQAARRQIECLPTVIAEALEQARATPESIDAIAVTKGPGLLGSLVCGTSAARMLSSLWQKPLVGVHHTLGHLSSTWLEQDAAGITFPLLTLSVSGGHTDLWYRESHTRGTLLGSTRDDAAGEAFDKGAALLGLPYPGGPSIAAAAEHGDLSRYPFPLPLKDETGFDFSFSGLKTALRYVIRDLPAPASTDVTAGLAASYQHAICRHLCDRLSHALKMHPDVTEVHIVGGVSANTHLRSMAATTVDPVRLRTPSKLQYCTDNAAMIAAAGCFLLQEHPETAAEPFPTSATLPLANLLRD